MQVVSPPPTGYEAVLNPFTNLLSNVSKLHTVFGHKNHTLEIVYKPCYYKGRRVKCNLLQLGAKLASLQYK